MAIGGVFIIGKGNAKLHVMPDFSKTPVLTDADVDGWLHYYEANVSAFKGFLPFFSLFFFRGSYSFLLEQYIYSDA